MQYDMEVKDWYWYITIIVIAIISIIFLFFFKLVGQEQGYAPSRNNAANAAKFECRFGLIAFKGIVLFESLKWKQY